MTIFRDSIMLSGCKEISSKTTAVSLVEYQNLQSNFILIYSNSSEQFDEGAPQWQLDWKPETQQLSSSSLGSGLMLRAAFPIRVRSRASVDQESKVPRGTKPAKGQGEVVVKLQHGAPPTASASPIRIKSQPAHDYFLPFTDYILYNECV